MKHITIILLLFIFILLNAFIFNWKLEVQESSEIQASMEEWFALPVSPNKSASL